MLSNPSVGLLSIGEDPEKGNAVVKEANQLLRNAGLNFLGNVEGRDIPNGVADVVERSSRSARGSASTENATDPPPCTAPASLLRGPSVVVENFRCRPTHPMP